MIFPNKGLVLSSKKGMKNDLNNDFIRLNCIIRKRSTEKSCTNYEAFPALWDIVKMYVCVFEYL